MNPSALLLLVAVALFLVSFVAIVGGSGEFRGLQTLAEDEVVQYIQARQFHPVDVVILPPYHIDTTTQTNLTVLSVLRFAPWFRRLHVYDKDATEAQDPVKHWETHQNSKIVRFSADLLTYSTTTPFLEERFILLRPGYALTNYVFMWQFFVGASPVVRSCRAGAMPLTRAVLNECAYLPANPSSVSELLAHSIKRGMSDGRIKYLDNRDHFVPACASSEVTSTREFKSNETALIREALRHEEVKKNRASPLEIVIVVQGGANDEIAFQLPASRASTVNIWVNLISDKVNQSARLSFIHRMIVSRHIFVELPYVKFDANPEKVGAEVMKQLHQVSNGQPFKVLEVYSYGSSDTSYGSKLANDVGNRLARAYASSFSPFDPKDAVSDTGEWRRLRYL